MSVFSKLFRRRDDFFEALILMLGDYRILNSAYVKTLLPEMKDALVLKRDSDKLLVSGDGFRFKLMFAPVPYLPGSLTKERLAAKSTNPPVSEAIMRHTACVSIFMDEETEPERRDLSREMLRRMVVALSDETTLAVWETETGAISTIGNFIARYEMEDKLYLLEETDDLGKIAQVQIGSLDEEIAEARSALPGFLSALKNASSEDSFFAKMKFEEGAKVEHMWVQVVSIRGKELTGTLLNQPGGLTGVREGDTVKKNLAVLSDLVYTDERGIHGPFTEKKVRSVLKESST